MSKQATPLYDLEYLSTVIVERSRYRVSLNGCVLGELLVEATGDNRRWFAVGFVGRFESQAAAIEALAERSRGE